MEFANALGNSLLVYGSDPAVYFIDGLTDLRFSTLVPRHVQLPFEFSARQSERLKVPLQFRIADHSSFRSVALTLQLFHAFMYSRLGVDPSLSSVTHFIFLLTRRCSFSHRVPRGYHARINHVSSRLIMFPSNRGTRGRRPPQLQDQRAEAQQERGENHKPAQDGNHAGESEQQDGKHRRSNPP